jgi:hypothetical protein
MNKLIYFSPVRWDSYYQRPHWFVKWYLNTKSNQVLWVDPFPSRLPKIKDIYSFIFSKHIENKNTKPKNFYVVNFNMIYIFELLAMMGINFNFIFKFYEKKVLKFTSGERDNIVIGKPSFFSRNLLLQHSNRFNFTYDFMDNFSLFHKGISRAHINEIQEKILRESHLVIASSSNLFKYSLKYNKNSICIKNACHIDNNFLMRKKKKNEQKIIFGYVGTISSWFDWDFIISIALNSNNSIVKIFGPCYENIPKHLPRNILVFPKEIKHMNAIRKMSNFDVGLIPFKNNSLTKYVDPIKYYEYRSLGLKVLSSDFGEMREHKKKDKKLFIFNSKINSLGFRSSEFKNCENNFHFYKKNNWNYRFLPLKEYFF